MPASHANPEVVSAFRREEREQTVRFADKYLSICCAAKVKASVIVAETDQIQKGIVDLVVSHNIRKLVIRAETENSYCSPQNSTAGYLDAYSEIMEERINGQLIETKREAEEATDESFAELIKCRRSEAEATEAIRKVKLFESAHAHEVELRKEAEVALRDTVLEQQKLLEESEHISGELQMTMRNVALLDSHAKETTRRRDEAAHELLLIQTSISTLWQERQQIRRQKMEALRWLERWKSRGQIGAAHYNGGGIGCIYKGEMLGRTVTIKKFHQQNVQGPAEFHREVQILSSLQHPHLLTLLGVCPEAWSIVYEYLPNGTLQDYLFRKSNIIPLTWNIRARMIAEISSALFARYLNSEESLYSPSFHLSTEPKGAFTYTDPEFQRTGDSVGLVLVRHAVSCGKLSSILDSSAGECPLSVASRLVELGLQCCAQNRRNRPELTPTLVRELEQLHVSEERPVPSFFLCPILQEIMHGPQIAADGFTHEGDAIREWLENGHDTSLQSHRVLSKATRAPPPHCSEIRFPDLRSSSSPGSGIATSSVIQFRRKRNSIVRCSVTPSARLVLSRVPCCPVLAARLKCKIQEFSFCLLG
ncbi:U-box domain-containing protein [Trifolium repens]|nr:U-box domain-containing protein [Trifolium repens]